MSKYNELVSIIVPIFNAERYIGNCLDSILSQNYKNIEVLLINDGSTDNSKKIIEDYKNRDSRINIINQENLGAPEARNKGIKLSKGKYLMFFDSDDILNEDSIELLVNSISKNDASIVIRKL